MTEKSRKSIAPILVSAAGICLLIVGGLAMIARVIGSIGEMPLGALWLGYVNFVHPLAPEIFTVLGIILIVVGFAMSQYIK